MAIHHQPPYYETQLKTLNSNFSVVLNEMTLAFPYAKVYPDISSISERYSNDRGEMDKIRSDIFLFRDNIEQDIDSNAKTITRTIAQIERIEKDNKKLIIRMQGLENKKKGAIGMYDDSLNAYNFKVLENSLVLLGSVALSYGIYKLK